MGECEQPGAQAAFARRSRRNVVHTRQLLAREKNLGRVGGTQGSRSRSEAPQIRRQSLASAEQLAALAAPRDRAMHLARTVHRSSSLARCFGTRWAGRRSTLLAEERTVAQEVRIRSCSRYWQVALAGISQCAHASQRGCGYHWQYRRNPKRG